MIGRRMYLIRMAGWVRKRVEVRKQAIAVHIVQIFRNVWEFFHYIYALSKTR
jgi:hypothetical protein